MNPFRFAAEQGVAECELRELAYAFVSGVASDVWDVPCARLLHGLYFAEWRRTVLRTSDYMPLDFGGRACWDDLYNHAYNYLFPAEPLCHVSTCVA